MQPLPVIFDLVSEGEEVSGHLMSLRSYRGKTCGSWHKNGAPLGGFGAFFTVWWNPTGGVKGDPRGDAGVFRRGPMCHAAIVCREYGLPTVVGTGKGTQLIKTGDLVWMDGDTGLVKIKERAK